MSEGRCDTDISSIREAHPTGELEWLEKFDTTCGESAGHEGEHVFQSRDAEDQERLHWDSDAKRFSSYQSAPPAPEERIVF
ncbi:MAG TPA: hypothetical protein VGB75_00215 [Jatrophihabitans sp.]|jgi:hypothetical protein|uniref:hypothetical protein n=1 Tax=Jatrophihabitans sp. TaxID=1932789 RepID=UPI002F12216C